MREAAQDICDFVRNGKKLPDHFDMKHASAAAMAYAGMTMKNDFKTIYGFGVVKTDFTFPEDE